MAEYGRIYLDTNIFIQLKEHINDTARSLVDMIGRLPDGRPTPFFTSELTLAELLVKPYSENNDRLITVYDNWIRSSSWLTVGPVAREALYFAGVLRSQFPHIKLPDAIHLSVAFGARCSHFMTSDLGIKQSYSLFHTRYGHTAGPLEISVIRPTRETIDSIIASYPIDDLPAFRP